MKSTVEHEKGSGSCGCSALLADLFLIGGLKSMDVYEVYPNLSGDTGWGRGLDALMELIGLKIIATKCGARDNYSDGERHAIFDVGAGGEWATHRVDAKWNGYSWTSDQIKILCGEHDCWKLTVREIPPYKAVLKSANKAIGDKP